MIDLRSNGTFVISLDFELLWGVFDVVKFEEKINYFENTRLVIPKILKVFEEKEIHATWATVGMLFNNDWEEWNQNIPDELPEYSDPKLSPYAFGKSIQKLHTEDLCFAPGLIKLIADTKGQEIGTHTYSHYYCLEQGQDLKKFKADLEVAVKLSGKMDVQLRSLVFPRNQFRKEYLRVCYEMGIENVRTNPTNWYWKDVKSNSLLTKLARTGDAYFPFGKMAYPLETKNRESLPLEQKASRFFRPVEDNSFLRKLKLNRILYEMTTSARNKEVYHLWWHPHNFGDHPVESLNDLIIILNHFRFLKGKYGYQSLNMQELNYSL